MPGKQIDVVGLKALRKDLKKAGDDMSDLKAAGLEAAEPVKDEARILVPKLTGALDGSIRSSGTQTGAVVRAGRASIPWAKPQHFGWPARNIRPTLFIYDGLDNRRTEVINIYQERINTIAKKF